MVALSTVLSYNQSLKALNVSRPILFSVEDETTDHFARTLKVRVYSIQYLVLSVLVVSMALSHWNCRVIRRHGTTAF